MYYNPILFRSHRGADTLIQQAREWESSGEYPRAVECYVKVTKNVTQDTNVLEKCWLKAGELSIKFLGQERAASVVELVAPRLMEIGKNSHVSFFIHWSLNGGFSLAKAKNIWELYKPLVSDRGRNPATFNFVSNPLPPTPNILSFFTPPPSHECIEFL